MADDKGGGGGAKGWTALEIIIVLILAIGFLDRLTGNSPITPTTNPPKSVTTTPSASDPKCGLTLIRPYSNQQITTSVSIVGNVTGCNWVASATSALSVQIVDSAGLPLSDYTMVPITTTDTTGKVSFASDIVLTVRPVTTSGFVILIPATDPQSKHISTRIPIKFAQ